MLSPSPYPFLRGKGRFWERGFSPRDGDVLAAEVSPSLGGRGDSGSEAVLREMGGGGLAAKQLS